MTRTLLIDDLREIEADVIARNYDAGIHALMTMGPFSTLYLDHDLGDYSYGLEKTGYDIICWLEANPEYLPKEIVLVTSNPVDRGKMQSVIDRLYKK
jgi:hypothetical protein